MMTAQTDAPLDSPRANPRRVWLVTLTVLAILCTVLMIHAEPSTRTAETPTMVPDPDPSFATILASWRDAALEPGGFAPSAARLFGANECEAGAISGLRVTLCRFSSPSAAQRAVKVALSQIGEVTGAAIASGALLIIVSDPSSTDPSGTTLNRVLGQFERTAKG